MEVNKIEQEEESWYGIAVSAWSGYTIECPNCGEIYRSRQYWYGNRNPEEVAIRKKITHVWNTVNIQEKRILLTLYDLFFLERHNTFTDLVLSVESRCSV